jgi:hypothetical protein
MVMMMTTIRDNRYQIDKKHCAICNRRLSSKRFSLCVECNKEYAGRHDEPWLRTLIRMEDNRYHNANRHRQSGYEVAMPEQVDGVDLQYFTVMMYPEPERSGLAIHTTGRQIRGWHSRSYWELEGYGIDPNMTDPLLPNSPYSSCRQNHEYRKANHIDMVIYDAS